MQRAKALELLREKLKIETPLTGEEMLEQLPWDSIHALEFLSLADEHFGVQVAGDQLFRCQTVAHLLNLLGVA